MSRTPHPGHFFSPAQLADILNVSRRTIMRWIRNGELHAIRIGNVTRISPDDYQRFIGEYAMQPDDKPRQPETP